MGNEGRARVLITMELEVDVIRYGKHSDIENGAVEAVKRCLGPNVVEGCVSLRSLHVIWGKLIDGPSFNTPDPTTKIEFGNLL